MSQREGTDLLGNAFDGGSGGVSHPALVASEFLVPGGRLMNQLKRRGSRRGYDAKFSQTRTDGAHQDLYRGCAGDDKVGNQGILGRADGSSRRKIYHLAGLVIGGIIDLGQRNARGTLNLKSVDSGWQVGDEGRITAPGDESESAYIRRDLLQATEIERVAPVVIGAEGLV